MDESKREVIRTEDHHMQLGQGGVDAANLNTGGRVELFVAFDGFVRLLTRGEVLQG